MSSDADRGDMPSIVFCANGPVLVRGSVRLENTDGAVIQQGRRTVAICRCGASARKPFCDGTHKLIGFTTDDQNPRS